MPEGINDQSKQRRYKKVRDQHGRRWGGSFELKSGDFAGQIEFIEPMLPDARFHRPPWLPPQSYIRPVKDNPYRVRIDYTAIRREAAEASSAYKRLAIQTGQKLQGDRFEADRPFSPQVLAVIGLPPVAVDVVIAAEQGNPWIIGKTTTPDVRLQKFLLRSARMPEPDYSKLDYGQLDPSEPIFSDELDGPDNLSDEERAFDEEEQEPTDDDDLDLSDLPPGRIAARQVDDSGVPHEASVMPSRLESALSGKRRARRGQEA